MLTVPHHKEKQTNTTYIVGVCEERTNKNKEQWKQGTKDREKLTDQKIGLKKIHYEEFRIIFYK